MLVIHFKTLLRRFAPLAESSSALTDNDLLNAFCLDHKSGAFAEIVDRHGTMVLGVCTRLLGNIHDAEDAFQATFLVLARKATAVRNRSSLSSYLHGVAIQIAQNLLRAKRHQKTLETRVALEARQQSERDYQWSEVQAVLDEEIQKLPVHYRDVFIQCCVDGQSRADAAQFLGVKEGTLSSRLTCAKKLLQVRLSRRGISLGTLLGALSLNMVLASQELRARTAKRVVEYAAGFASASMPLHIIALAQKVPTSSLFYPVLATLVLLIAIGAGVVLATIPAASAQANETSVLASPDPVTPKTNVTKLSAHGTVVSPEGKPLAGATVYLREWSFLRSKRDQILPVAGRDIVAQMTTDQTGQFIFNKVEAPPLTDAFIRSQSPYEILVIARGCAPIWQHLTPPLQKLPLRMQVAKSASITGVITDASGKPAMGAVVKLLDIGPLRRAFELKLTSDGYVYFHDSALRIETTVDATGRFTLSDLPDDVCVCLEVTYGGYSEPPLYVAVTSGAQPRHCLAQSSLVLSLGSPRRLTPFSQNCWC